MVANKRTDKLEHVCMGKYHNIMQFRDCIVVYGVAGPHREFFFLELKVYILIHSGQKSLVLLETAFRSQEQPVELCSLLSNFGMFYTTPLYLYFFCYVDSLQQ